MRSTPHSTPEDDSNGTYAGESPRGGAHPPHLEPLRLEHHIQWLRQLARSLVADPGLADDLVQETALAALQAPPAFAEDGPRGGPGSGPRAWLGRVLRNRLGDAKRQSQSRSLREERRAVERSALGPAAGPAVGSARGRGPGIAAGDLVAQVEAERMLSEELLRLEEPMRETLMLRFYEGLAPRKIAARQGVPVATVKSRLARGLARMRKNLDERHGGDRRMWIAAVLPMAKKAGAAMGAGTSATVISIGGLALNVKLALVFAVTAAVSGTLYLLASPGEPADVSAAPDPGDKTIVAAEETPAKRRAYGVGPEEIESDLEREPAAVAESSPASAAPPPAPPTQYVIEGTVLDAEARAVAGVPIAVQGAAGTSPMTQGLALSGAGGRFRFTTESAAGTLVAGEPDEEGAASQRWVTVRAGTYRASAGSDADAAAAASPLLIVARAIDLEGIVVDDWGAPLPGLRVILDLPGDFVARFDQSQAKSVRQDWRAMTDEEGRFLLEGVPSVGGASIEAATVDGRSARIDAPATNASDLRLVIAAPPIPIERRLAGRVVRADGSEAGGARVSLGAEMVRAEDDGTFEIDLRRAGNALRLAAIEPGSLMGAVARPGDSDDGRGGWPDFVEVRLPGKAFSIKGRVVDAEGAPKAGARVWLHDPTEFGFLGAFPIRAEGLAASLDDPFEAARSRGRLIDQEGPMDESTATGAESPTSMLPFSVTDAEGRFEIEGLQDRRYVLNVAGPKLDYGMQSESVPAGDSVTLEIPEGGVYAAVKGRLVTRRGDPLANVYITPWLGALAKDFSIKGGSSSITRFFFGPGVRSDAEGRFELTDVPMQHIQFWIAGDGVAPASRSVSDIRDPDDFVIELAARTEVSVEILDAASGIDGITAQSFSGEGHGLMRIYADGSTNVARLSLDGGRSGVFALTTDAATITLMRGAEAVEVIDLDGDPGEVQRIVR